MLTLSYHPLSRAALAVTLGLVCASPGYSQGDGAGLPGSGLTNGELTAALKLLQEELAAEKAKRRELIESLASAVSLSEEQVVATREMQLKLQAFGVDLFTQDENSLEQRLLKAVRDLDISQQEMERRSDSLRQLNEAFLTYLSVTPTADAKARENAEAAIRKSSALLTSDLAQSEEAGAEFSQSKVVSVDAGIGLIVFDAGRRQGLRVGTPVTVTRDDRTIYTALIVDVRDGISGALLQDKVAEIAEVAVGDGIKLMPNMN